MKPSKISTLLIISTLPFFASCATWHEASIANGLDRGSLTYSAALEAMNNGADVKGNFAGKCFLEQAAKLNRQDLIELFVEKGGVSCFEADAGYKNKPFSLFLYAFNTRNEGLMLYCLEHLDKSQTEVKPQLMDVAKGTFDSLISGEAWFASAQVLEKIRQSGLLTDEESKHFSPESIRLTKSRKFLGLCESGSLDSYLYRHGNGIFKGIDVNAKDSEGNSGLVLFLKNSLRNSSPTWEDVIKAFIAAGADVNARDIEGRSVLYLCFTHENCDEDIMKILRNAGARFTAEEATALLSKIVEEKSDSIAGLTWNELIFQGADVNTRIRGCSLLYVAKSNGSELCSVLEDAGAKLLPEESEVLQKRLNAYLVNAVKSGNVYLIRRYIENGADVNTKVDGHSLLYVAKSNGSGFCFILESAGAELLPEEREVFQKRLNTDLISAVKSGDVELVERCIKNGADVNVNTTAKDGTIHSLLMVPELLAIPNEAMYAVAQRQDEPGWFLALSGYSSAPKKIATILKNAGAKMSKEDEELVKTVRLQAHIAGGNWGEIAEGIKTGTIDLNSKFSNGENCFHALADCQLEIDESFVPTLKNSGCDINKKSETGYSPLAKAIEKTSAAAVKVLLKYGGNPNDTIPIKGAFGNAGTKKLMTLAIDVYNKCVDEQRNTNYSDSDAVEEARSKTRRAKEIVSLMSQATGTSVTEL